MYDHIYYKQTPKFRYRIKSRNDSIITLRTLYSERFRHDHITNVMCCDHTANNAHIEPNDGFMFRIENDLWTVIWSKNYQNRDAYYDWNGGGLFKGGFGATICCKSIVMLFVGITIILA